MRIGQKLKRQLGFLMSVLCAVSLVACGTKYADAPALLEPVSGTESYREVSVGDVGDLKIAYGSIVPTEHAVFWTTQVSVAEVLVDVGDYVEAGQVVATADLEAAQKAKQDLEEARSLLVQKRELEVQKQQLTIQKLNLKQAGENQLGDSDSAAKQEKRSRRNRKMPIMMNCFTSTSLPITMIRFRSSRRSLKMEPSRQLQAGMFLMCVSLHMAIRLQAR